MYIHIRYESQARPWDSHISSTSLIISDGPELDNSEAMLSPTWGKSTKSNHEKTNPKYVPMVTAKNAEKIASMEFGAF